MKLQQLKDIAAKVGYKYHHMTGAAKLEEELRTYCIEIGTSLEEVASEIGGTEQPHTVEPKLPTKDSSVNMVEKLLNSKFQKLQILMILLKRIF